MIWWKHSYCIDRGRAGVVLTKPPLTGWMNSIHSLSASHSIPTLDHSPSRMLTMPHGLGMRFPTRTISHFYNARTITCILETPTWLWLCQKRVVILHWQLRVTERSIIKVNALLMTLLFNDSITLWDAFKHFILYNFSLEKSAHKLRKYNSWIKPEILCCIFSNKLSFKEISE